MEIEIGHVEELCELLHNLCLSIKQTTENTSIEDIIADNSYTDNAQSPTTNSITNYSRTRNKSINDNNQYDSYSYTETYSEINENCSNVLNTDLLLPPENNSMFECVNTIPHIDSDEDVDENCCNTLGYFESTFDNGGKNLRDYNIPKFIKDIPEKLFMSGIYIPGTVDKDDKPLVICDGARIIQTGITYDDIVRLILYFYTIINGTNKQKESVTIVVLTVANEEKILNILDTAFAILTTEIKVNKILVYRQNSNSSNNKTIQKTLLNSNLMYLIVTDLQEYVSKENLPISSDNGIQTHDQLEWFEFFKEYEQFLQQCLSCATILMTTMKKIQNNNDINKCNFNNHRRQISWILNHPDILLLNRDGPTVLEHLDERAQWLKGNRDVQMAKIRAERCFNQINHVYNCLKQLNEQCEQFKELKQIKVLHEELTQGMKWLETNGNCRLKELNKLMKYSDITQDSIKKLEREFEEFYYTAVKYMDKMSDLFEEIDNSVKPATIEYLKEELEAENMKTQVKIFSETLEETKKYLDDLIKYFQLNERMHVENSPIIKEEQTTEMMKLANKLKNDTIIRNCMSMNFNMVQQKDQKLSHFNDNNSNLLEVSSKDDKSTVIDLLRRKFLNTSINLYKCTHQGVDDKCKCYDFEEKTNTLRKIKKTFLPTQQQQYCTYKDSSHTTQQNNIELCHIKELKNEISHADENSLNLLNSNCAFARDDKTTDSGVSSGCNSKCDDQSSKFVRKSRTLTKKRIHRTCSCQYLNGSESCGVCCTAESTTTSGSGGSNIDHTEHHNSDNNVTESENESFNKSNMMDELEDLEEYFLGDITSFTRSNDSCCLASHLHSSHTVPVLDPKTQRTVNLIMQEMIQTERDYVKSLDYVIENYIPELTREDIPQALRGQRNVVFGNIEKIYEFHNQNFLRELEECAKNPLQVGQCFLRHENKFYLYALYNKNKPKSDSLMSEYGSIFFKKKQLELEDKMDLASYLLKPVQRMGKYALLLQQLMKAYSSNTTPSQEKDKEKDAIDIDDLKAAERMVRFQLRHGNDLLAMDSLRDCDVNLKEQGRLLRQNEFLVGEGRGGKKHIRQVFLFEELILFSKANRFPDRKNLDHYIYKNSIKMTDIGMTEKIGNSTTKFEIWFRKRKRNDTFVLQATTEEIKKAWTEEISQLLWKQAMRNREIRLQEMSSMGIGNKPCLDIRPSEDQINDRSVNITQLHKALKFRNSISVDANNRNNKSYAVASSTSSGSVSSTCYNSLNRHNNVYKCIVNSEKCLDTEIQQRNISKSQYLTESDISSACSLTSDGCSKSTSSVSSKSTKSSEAGNTCYNISDSLSINL